MPVVRISRHLQFQPRSRPAYRIPIPPTEVPCALQEKRSQSLRHLLEKGRPAICRPDRLPELPVLLTAHPPGLVLGTRAPTAALHRNGAPLRTVRRHDLEAVPERPLLVMFTSIEADTLGLRGSPPWNGREGAQGKPPIVNDHRTALNIRFQRIPDSPCCSAFILLNHVKDARPTTWSSGTKPQYRLSAELWRLSPMSQ